MTRPEKAAVSRLTNVRALGAINHPMERLDP